MRPLTLSIHISNPHSPFLLLSQSRYLRELLRRYRRAGQTEWYGRYIHAQTPLYNHFLSSRRLSYNHSVDRHGWIYPKALCPFHPAGHHWAVVTGTTQIRGRKLRGDDESHLGQGRARSKVRCTNLSHTTPSITSYPRIPLPHVIGSTHWRSSPLPRKTSTSFARSRTTRRTSARRSWNPPVRPTTQRVKRRRSCMKNTSNKTVNSRYCSRHLILINLVMAQSLKCLYTSHPCEQLLISPLDPRLTVGLGQRLCRYTIKSGQISVPRMGRWCTPGHGVFRCHIVCFDWWCEETSVSTLPEGDLAHDVSEFVEQISRRRIVVAIGQRYWWSGCWGH